jgi:hypothetical protein
MGAESRQLDEPLLARAGNLENRAILRLRAVKGQICERLGDASRRDDLRPHLGHLDHVDDEPLHAGRRTGLREVASRGDEELCGLGLIRPGRGGDVDHGVGAAQGLGKALAADHVDPCRSRHRHDLLAAILQHIHHVAPHPSGRPSYGDPALA